MAVSPPRKGTVSTFDEAAGLGTVVDADSRSWTFHCTRISDGSRSIDVGAGVMFQIGPGAPGRWEATSVVKLG